MRDSRVLQGKLAVSGSRTAADKLRGEVRSILAVAPLFTRDFDLAGDHPQVIVVSRLQIRCDVFLHFLQMPRIILGPPGGARMNWFANFPDAGGFDRPPCGGDRRAALIPAQPKDRKYLFQLRF